jgi:hypothetical protein
MSVSSEPDSKPNGRSRLNSIAEKSSPDISRTRKDSRTSPSASAPRPRSTKRGETISPKSIALPPASRAKTLALLEDAPDCMVSELDSFLILRASCEKFDPLGLSSKMFPDFSVRTVEETLRKSSAFSWSSAGMGFHGVSSTANISESPNVAVVCLLSEVLEDRVPQRFFLSPQAAKGILRRASKRGRILPPRLQAALESLATTLDGDGKTILISQSERKSVMRSQRVQAFQDATIPMEKRMSSQTRFENPMDTTDEVPHAETDAITSLPPHSTVAATRGDFEPSRESTSSSRMFEDIARKNKTASESMLEALATRSTKPASTQSLSQKINAAKSESQALVHSSAQVEESLAAGIQPLPLHCEATQAEQAKATTQPTPSQKICETEVRDQPIMSVRRLTPTECEILQGFPKGWTLPDTAPSETPSRRRLSTGLRSASPRSRGKK